MKNKQYRVNGVFLVEFNKIVSAPTEAKAIRKARDYALNRKLKVKNFQKDNVCVWEV